ncbi:hypothetical protein [Stakelama marina]
MTHESLEDLGWNDMGDQAPIDQVSSQLTPEPAAREVPQVLRQRERLDEQFAKPAVQDMPEMPEAETDIGPAKEEAHAVEEAKPAPEPAQQAQAESEPEQRSVSLNTAKRIRRETRHKRGKSAAFTLRLDEERHLRLRLASAISGTSAQMLVTEALDAFLETMPEVDGLVRQVGDGRGR